MNTIEFFCYCTLIFLSAGNCEVAQSMQRNLPEIVGDIFYYFGYGSNMLEKRIHIQNPTAKKVGGAKLEHWRLDFYGYTSRWLGAPATIVPTEQAYTYGTLWAIELQNLRDLDDQEGVFENDYKPVSVNVTLNNNGTVIVARAYQLVEQPINDLSLYDNEATLPPYDRQPSKTYLQCLVKGAEETGLPANYIKKLRSVKHNNAIAKDLEGVLELQNVTF